MEWNTKTCQKKYWLKVINSNTFHAILYVYESSKTNKTWISSKSQPTFLFFLFVFVLEILHQKLLMEASKIKTTFSVSPKKRFLDDFRLFPNWGNALKRRWEHISWISSDVLNLYLNFAFSFIKIILLMQHFRGLLKFLTIGVVFGTKSPSWIFAN